MLAFGSPLPRGQSASTSVFVSRARSLLARNRFLRFHVHTEPLPSVCLDRTRVYARTRVEESSSEPRHAAELSSSPWMAELDTHEHSDHDERTGHVTISVPGTGATGSSILYGLYRLYCASDSKIYC